MHLEVTNFGDKKNSIFPRKGYHTIIQFHMGFLLTKH